MPVRTHENRDAPRRDWGLKDVNCEECGKKLSRKLYLPNPPYNPIKHFFCDKMCKGLWQKRAKLLTKNDLYDLYVNQKKDCVVIGKLVGRDPKNIWNWLKDYGIETRSRGTDPD